MFSSQKLKSAFNDLSQYWNVSVENTSPNIKLSELLADNNDEVVFDRSAVVTVQPFSGQEPRNLLPISTISGPDFRLSQILPVSGLALLYDVQEITLEQMVNVEDLLSTIDSENKFLVKTDGQTIYGGYEYSSVLQRLICGVKRQFVLRLFDRSQQEALYVTRRLACSLPLIGCHLQRMEVFEPPSTFLGCIQQLYTTSGSSFSIRDANDHELYTMTGPSSRLCSCCSKTDVIFPVMDVSGDGITSVEYTWDQKIMSYKLTIKFPYEAGLKERSLLLSAGLLLEYVFFLSVKSNMVRCLKCWK